MRSQEGLELRSSAQVKQVPTTPARARPKKHNCYRCEYVSRLGVFKNNEHVMVTTILELTAAFFGGGGGTGGDRGPGGSGEAAVSRALGDYVRVASFVMLRLKLRQQVGGASGSGSGSNSTLGFQFFCMYAFLDKFVEQCPQVGGILAF